ncbi:hypothetical protein [Chamaesiphon sp. OTE_20_metabat_361]|uniref:hypothetical protein n=1 Tax=Chamaesiphon sp. OTE_20_metabat_361 TaxID=2964689 RepID=UPI00286B7C3F|nr:hypothetical protein [Chamaesiphon sp. OTE_20_metabat_361]
MEDPIKFDLWCSIKKGFAKEGIAVISQLMPHLTKLETHLTINHSVVSSSQILLARSLSWAEVNDLKNRIVEFVVDTNVCQEGYNPNQSKNHYCKNHELIYGGCLGCHVCRNFYL